jgi:hypothetical protein
MNRESKAELTDRLRQEGRFEAFKKRREELKASGVPAKEAWWQAAAEFPSPTAPPAPAKSPAIDLSALKGKKPIPVALMAAWVAENLDADWITPADAPSPGAWSMREWARSSPSTRSEFYKTFVAKIVMPPQEALRRQKEEKDADHERLMKQLFGHIEPEPVEPEMSEAEEKEKDRRMQIRLREI